MKNGKATEPYSIVSEMVKTAQEAGGDMITDLLYQIIVGFIPAEWELCTIVNCLRHSLERGSYRRLRLTDQILNITKRVIEKLIRDKVDFDEMQFGFMPGCRTTNAPFLSCNSCRRNNQHERIYYLYL